VAWSEHRRVIGQPAAPRQSATAHGLKFGVGFALAIFVVIPILFIGGCAALIAAAGSTDTPTEAAQKTTAVTPVVASDLRHVAKVAIKDVRSRRPNAALSASCTSLGKKAEDYVPDSWKYDCAVSVTPPGRAQRTVHRPIYCFDPPPYTATNDSCGID
jgi:hypothetical protein